MLILLEFQIHFIFKDYYSNSTSDAKQHLRWPSFKGGDSKESHHGHEDVVKVEITVVPDPLLHHGQRRIPVVVENVGTSVI